MAARELCLVGENAAQVEAAGRLALSAGKGANLHLARGVTVVGVRHHGKRATDIVDDHGGNIDAVIDLGHVRHGAIGNRRDQILALKRTALANEQRPRTHLARVVGRKLYVLVAHGIRLEDNEALGLEQLHVAHQSQLLLRRTRHITTSLVKPNLKKAKPSQAKSVTPPVLSTILICHLTLWALQPPKKLHGLRHGLITDNRLHIV